MEYTVFEWVRAILALIGVIALFFLAFVAVANYDERVRLRREEKKKRRDTYN